jgi:hypothetical protein
MIRRIVTLALAFACLGLASYAWYRYATWQAVTELRQVAWDPEPELHGWTGADRGGSVAGFLAAAYRCEDRGPVIVHRGSELSFCGDLGDYDDREHSHGLWAFDYAHGKATLAYPIKDEPRLLLPKSDDIAALGTDRELGIAGPAGWLAPPARLDLEAGGGNWFHVAGIVWRGDQAHVLAIREPGRPGEPEPPPVARELVVGNPKLSTVLDVARARHAMAVARYLDGQWWVVVRDLGPVRWIGLDHGETPVALMPSSA